jgi:hypothetical protein
MPEKGVLTRFYRISYTIYTGNRTHDGLQRVERSHNFGIFVMAVRWFSWQVVEVGVYRNKWMNIGGLSVPVPSLGRNLGPAFYVYVSAVGAVGESTKLIHLHTILLIGSNKSNE